MKTHNAIIYHCLRCGNLTHRDPEQEQPTCCGRKMVKAAEETIFGDENEDEPLTGAVGDLPEATDITAPKPR